MKYFLFIIFCSMLNMVSMAQDFTNKGKDFWVCFPAHVPSRQNLAKMNLFITGDKASKGQITVGDGSTFTTSFSITANGIASIDIPYDIANISDAESFKIVKKGIHVIVDEGYPPVVLYAHIYAVARSAATLVLPTNVLGKKYYSMNVYQGAASPGLSQFQIIALEDNTTVKITPRINGVLKSSLPYITLPQKGDVYQFQDQEDLSGTLIETVALNPTDGCKKISVFSGSSAVSITTDICIKAPNTVDPLFQQLYPVSSWGNSYAFVPFADYPVGNPYRIMAAMDNTTVKVNGVNVTTLNAGEYFPSTVPDMHLLNAPVMISATNPISVAQYAQCRDCNGSSPSNNLGDPDMVVLNSLDQEVNNITVFSSTKENIVDRFIQVVIRDSIKSTFMINGQSIASWQPISPISAGYVYSKIKITDNAPSYLLSAKEGFNAIAYGFGDPESYAYSAGTSVKDLYQYLSAENERAKLNIAATCNNSPFKLTVSLPYEVSSLQWKFGNVLNGLGMPDTTYLISSTVAPILVSGKPVYQYTLDRLYNVSTINTYPIKIIAEPKTITGDCGNFQDLDFELQVYTKPIGDFSSSYSGCLSDPIQLTDLAKGYERTIIEHLWDLNDGLGLIKQKTPSTFSFTSWGSKNLVHQVINDIGCVSTLFQKQVDVYPNPIVDFTHATPICEQQAVTFSAQTSIADPLGSIVTTSWYFENAPASTSSTYTFPSFGNFPVRVEVTSDKGCSTSKSKNITVDASPSVTFSVPDVCLNDYYAIFTNETTISDLNQTLQYNWTFGDPNASASNPDNSPFPQHHYTAIGTYQVKLKATASQSGCSTSLTQPFKVNGMTPKALFDINGNDLMLCSNQPVGIIDRSVVLDGGDIVKVEVYWDYDRNPLLKTLDNDPLPGKLYNHNYPDNNNNVDISYHIKYIAYSGISCVNEIDRTILVKASPSVKFGPLDPVCNELPPFMIPAAVETRGILGSGTYSGNGITNMGLFSPQKVSAGTQVLTYTFTGLNGCVTQSTSPLEIYPTPTSSAGPDLTCLEGGSVMLQGSGSGKQIQYIWSPFLWMSDFSIAGPKVFPTDNITYTLTVVSNEGCTAKDDVFVKVLKMPVVPNVFSPNGDGINDQWVIPYLADYEGATVDVYNRYGQPVYHSVNYTKPWDGTKNGTPLPVATYYWIIHPKNGRLPMNGSITIIR